MKWEPLRRVFGSIGRIVLAILPLCCFLSTAFAQGPFYTFTSGPGGDGFEWPTSPTGLLPGEYFITPDGVEVDNYIGNNLFFDENYLVSGNSPDIDGNAMWGDPNSGTLDFYLSGLGTQSVAFNFAQSVGGEPFLTNDYINIYIQDSEGRSTQFSPTLGNTFIGLGGFDGYSDVVQFDTSFLIDDFESVDGGPLIDIDYFSIDLYSLDNTSYPAEFAVDNLSLDGASGELDPENSDLYLGTSGIGTNRLRATSTGSSFFSFGFVDVQNFGTGGTTYSMTLDPSSDPEYVVDAPATNAFIAGGQTLSDGSGSIAQIDTGSPSGEYHASATLSNDLNPLDSDDQVSYRIRILDRPELSDDSGSIKQVHANPTVFIANAAAGPHAGALRASVEVTSRTLSGDGFSAVGLQVGDLVEPAETEEATISFDRFGRINGNYAGTLAVDLKMVDTEFSFLNGAEAVPSSDWDLSYLLVTTNSDSAAAAIDESLAKKVGVNNAATAATLLDGDSPAAQTVSMQFVANPAANGDLATDAVDLEFSSGNVDPYVLQFTYTDANVPEGFAESQLQVLSLGSGGQWEIAIDANSTSNSTYFTGSYADYLAGPGGGVFDANDLGAFGVDAVNNRAWAVLDHASVFALGVLTAGLPGDFDLDGDVDGRDFLAWQRSTSVGDLADWQSNYGAGPLSSVNAVPEPATALGITIVMGMIYTLHGRHRW